MRILKKKKEKKIKMKKIGKLLFVMVLFFSFSVFSETQTQVQASVDRDEMALGDSFTLTVDIKSNEDFDAAPALPNLKGIEVINNWADGKSSSTRMALMNGKSEFSKSVQQAFHFMLSPNKEGKLVIPVIDIAINNKTYKTQPLTISVAEENRGRGSSSKSKSGNSKGRGQLLPGMNEEDPFGGEDDIFSQMLKEREKILNQLGRGGIGGNPFGGTPGMQENIPEKKMDINKNDPFFLVLEADRSEAYEGQQITANWYIYVRGQIESLDRTKFPDLKGFWKEIIEEVPSLQFTPEIINGVPFQKALLASHALFPIKPGVAVIDEFKIKARTRVPTPFGMGKSHDTTKVSKRFPIKVLPLPLQDRPINFSGAVGSFQVSVRTDGKQFPAHQPFSVKVRFEGSGNAKLIDLPNIAWPQNLEVFDTKSESKFFKNGQSYKEFEILLIPRKEGELIIPAFEFSHFNPELKKYVTTNSEPVTLTITPGSAGAVMPSLNGKSKSENSQAAAYSAQPIMEFPEANSINSNMRYGMYLVIFLFSICGMSISFFRKIKNLKQEPILSLIVSKKMQQIQNNVSLKNYRQVGAEGVNLVYALAAYLSGQKSASQEWFKLTENMPIKLKDKFLPRLSTSFDYFQALGFSPDAIHQSIVSSNKTESEIEKLKKLAHEISLELIKNENE